MRSEFPGDFTVALTTFGSLFFLFFFVAFFIYPNHFLELFSSSVLLDSFSGVRMWLGSSETEVMCLAFGVWRLAFGVWRHSFMDFETIMILESMFTMLDLFCSLSVIK